MTDASAASNTMSLTKVLKIFAQDSATIVILGYFAHILGPKVDSCYPDLGIQLRQVSLFTDVEDFLGFFILLGFNYKWSFQVFDIVVGHYKAGWRIKFIVAAALLVSWADFISEIGTRRRENRAM